MVFEPAPEFAGRRRNVLREIAGAEFEEFSSFHRSSLLDRAERWGSDGSAQPRFQELVDNRAGQRFFGRDEPVLRARHEKQLAGQR